MTRPLRGPTVARLFCTLLVCAATSLAATDRRCPGKEGSLTEFGQWSPKEKVIRAGNDANLLHIGARYLRIKIELVTGGVEPWTLFLLDRFHRVLQTVDQTDFGVSRFLWTDRLPSDKVLFELRGGPGTELRTLEYVAMPRAVADDRAYYSYVGNTPDWKDLHQGLVPEALRRLGGSVGFLTTSRAGKPWCCTGVIVQAQPELLLLTNFHCGAPPGLADSAFWTDELCERTFVDLSWDGDDISHEYRCREVLAPPPDGTAQDRATAANLDLALLRLEPVGPDVMPVEAVELGTFPRGGIAPSLNVIHHPRCMQKQVTRHCDLAERRRKGWREGSGESDFSHRCDTEGGSSGAPVFDSQSRLVGLHHLGYEPLADGSCDELNKAVRIDDIRAFLAAATEGRGNP